MKIEDYNEYYIQGTDHYLIPKDNFEELFNEMINWKEESQNLKKQVKIKEDGFKASTEELCEYAEENQELKKQLEERDKWLIICILELMKEYKTDIVWITNQQIEIVKDKNISYEVYGGNDIKFYQNIKK